MLRRSVPYLTSVLSKGVKALLSDHHRYSLLTTISTCFEQDYGRRMTNVMPRPKPRPRALHSPLLDLSEASQSSLTKASSGIPASNAATNPFYDLTGELYDENENNSLALQVPGSQDSGTVTSGVSPSGQLDVGRMDTQVESKGQATPNSLSRNGYSSSARGTLSPTPRDDSREQNTFGESDEPSSDDDDGKWNNAKWKDDFITKFGFTSAPPRQATKAHGAWLLRNKAAIERERDANAKLTRAARSSSKSPMQCANNTPLEVILKGSDRCRSCVRTGQRCVVRHTTRRLNVACEACRHKGLRSFACAVDPVKCGMTSKKAAEEAKRRSIAKAKKQEDALQSRRRQAAAQEQEYLNRQETTARQRMVSEKVSRAAVPTPIKMSPVRDKQDKRSSSDERVDPLIVFLRTINKVELSNDTKACLFSSLIDAQEGHEVAFYIDIMEQTLESCGDIVGLVQLHKALRAASVY